MYTCVFERERECVKTRDVTMYAPTGYIHKHKSSKTPANLVHNIPFNTQATVSSKGTLTRGYM